MLAQKLRSAFIFGKLPFPLGNVYDTVVDMLILSACMGTCIILWHPAALLEVQDYTLAAEEVPCTQFWIYILGGVEVDILRPSWVLWKGEEIVKIVDN